MTAWQELEQALARIGLPLYDLHKAQLLAMLKPLAINDANVVITAIAQHINMNGLAGAFQDTARNAVTGSEQTVDTMLENNLDAGAAAIDAWLKTVANGH